MREKKKFYKIDNTIKITLRHTNLEVPGNNIFIS